MWSRRSIEIFIGATVLAAVSACSVTPQRPAAPAVAQPVAAAKPGPPPIPAAAQAQFDRALALARAGNDAAAEAQLASLAQQYPRFCTPLLDLGILYRNSGNLDAAAHALRQAVARDPHSAPAWTELGITQRLGGRFQDAEQSYGRALAADPAYAPAYRDRGVLRDLYLDQPAAALGDFEQYRKLAGQDKPVVMWIAELQHRTGIKEPPASEHPVAAAGMSAQAPTPATAAVAPQPQARN
jgi:tetratricopeptide (TPR) repeat protein